MWFRSWNHTLAERMHYGTGLHGVLVKVVGPGTSDLKGGDVILMAQFRILTIGGCFRRQDFPCGQNQVDALSVSGKGSASRSRKASSADSLPEARGIAADLELPLPASFFWQVLKAWMPDVEASPFDRDTLSWRVRQALPQLLDQPAFDRLERYLTGKGSQESRLHQLCERIAEVFDQYLVFRPGMVLGWEAGEGTDWQPVLWRRITAGENRHRARLLEELLRAMERSPPRGPLPERAFLFGLNALPPVYLEILRRLGGHREVLIHHLNPCREYWADLRSQKQLEHHLDPQAAFLEVGNPLLASFGHVGQSFLDQLLSLDAETEEAYRAPDGSGLLQRIQEEILELRDGREAPRPVPEEAWPSLQLHGAHTRLREVQVLHDNLLRAFEELDGLTPRDILVMAPDMAAYAPFAEAVFGAGEGDARIPFRIGDRAAGEHPLAEAVRWLLGLPGHRFTASEVLALLEVDALQRRFGLDDEALERIRTWVREGGIRWGADAHHRQALALGMASLSSRKVQVESLFIDEGFGTLDARTLDMVIEVLDALQAQGRQVGVISRVTGLGEGVRAQVKVQPLGGGRSTLSIHAA